MAFVLYTDGNQSRLFGPFDSESKAQVWIRSKVNISIESFEVLDAEEATDDVLN